MDTNNSVNPSESVPVPLTTGDDDSAVFKREPPPPYSNETTSTSEAVVHRTVINHNQLKDKPTFYNCHKCGQVVLTRVEYINSRKTHLCAGFICGFALWCMLCCLAAVPYMINTCKKAHHYCPTCNTFLGAYSRI